MHTFMNPSASPNRQTASVTLPSKKSDKDPIGLAHDAVNSSSRPLDPQTRPGMENKFGHSFASVRVHDNPVANQSANMLGADAYTLGNDIVFNKSMPGFHTKSDADLLTHELVHVLQSGGVAAKSTSSPIHVSKPTDEAELEADNLSGNFSNSAVPQPSQRVEPGTLMRKMQVTQENFYDPNECYHNSLSDDKHPDQSHIVAVMQAEIETPDSCDGYLTLRTSVLQSGWGAAAANFESVGGGFSQGIYEGIKRHGTTQPGPKDDGRVDFEERFRLDTCRAQFTRCHLITSIQYGTNYVFAKARYEPNIFATSTATGTEFNDSTPPPTFEVNPCAGVSGSTC